MTEDVGEGVGDNKTGNGKNESQMSITNTSEHVSEDW